MLSGIILLENLRWLVPTTFMLGAAPAYISIWGTWRILSLFLPRWVYVKGDDFLFSTYHRNLLFFFETMTGVQLIFYGDLNALTKSENGENCIYMSNHQSTMDWVIASCVSMRRGSLGQTRYVLKDGLRFLPFYGFYLGMHGSLFVKRAGKFSKDRAEEQLRRDAEDKKPMWLVVFPEGTRFNPELVKTITDSKQFALDQDLDPLDCVLFPRVRAVQVCVDQLKNSLDSVYDVTIAYGNTFDFEKKERKAAPAMQDYLLGKSPTVHVHVSRIPIHEVPVETDQLKKWLYNRFQAKDRLLKEFYSAQSEEEARFPGVRVVKPLPLTALFPSALFWSGTFVLFNYSKIDRNVYWSVGWGAAFVGLVWMGIRH